MKKRNSSSANRYSDTEHVLVLKLYVTGASPNSARAIANLKDICEQHITAGYELEIIDVYQQPLNTQKEDIIALPMLVKLSPLPIKRLIGDMSNKGKVLKGLGLNTE